MALLKSWWNNLKGKWVFIFFATVATMYGGSKKPMPSVYYPSTEHSIGYLRDSGSYVTNDYVYISFQRIVVPETATLLIDRCRLGSTNIIEDAENFITTTFDQFVVPAIIPCTGATNWNWYVYTTWTPGPAVQTNGVWEVIWMTDKKWRGYIIPSRTVIIENGKRISPNPAIVSDEDLEKYTNTKSTYAETLNTKEAE